MKKHLLKTVLLAVALLLGTTSTWADDVDFVKGAVIGTENNSGGWWSGSTSVIDIPANKTLTLKFKTYSATDTELGETKWAAHFSHLIRIGYNNNSHTLFWRADGYGWLDNEKIGEKWATTNSSETNDNSWVACNESNMRWGEDGADFRADITGSDVTVTIIRRESDLIVIQDFEAASGNYRRYFVIDNVEANQNLWAQLVVEHAHIVATENYTISDTDLTYKGTLVGKLNKTGRLAHHGNIENFTVGANKSLSFNFVLHSTKLFDWGQWLYEVQQGTNLYTLSVGNQVSWNPLKQNEAIEKSANWPATNAELFEKMDGATVNLTVTRTGSEVKMTAIHTPLSGEPFTISSTITPSDEGFADNDITVRPLVELGYLDLLPAGTVVGTTDLKTGSLGAYSAPVTLSPNQKVTYKFYNYSDKGENFHNWIACIAGEEFATTSEAGLKVALRADNWENVQGANTGITSDYNWDTFRDEMDGANVELSFTYQNNAVIIRADITSKSNNSYFEEFTKKGVSDDKITVAVGVENSFLVITNTSEVENLPVVTESKNMSDAGWATYYTEKALDLTGEIEHLTDAYIITGAEDGHVATVSVKGEVVPANTGLLLAGEEGAIVLPVADSRTATAAVAGNALEGVVNETVKDAGTVYVLMTGDNGVGFYKNAKAFTVGAKTAYLPASFAEGATEGAPRFYALGGETTGIDNLNVDAEASKAEGPIYNLAGQRVGKGYKGLVIMNGKKVIIK